MSLPELLSDIAAILVLIDRDAVPFKDFQPGVGPYGEPQLLKLVSGHLVLDEKYGPGVKTAKTPDLLVPDRWALEFKLARPFGDNGKVAENWSVNLLHPYAGNTSLLGDCLKLRQLAGPERKAAVVVGYEHTPPQIPIEPLLRAFEVIADQVMGINLGARAQVQRSGLRHPVHQQLSVTGWEVTSSGA